MMVACGFIEVKAKTSVKCFWAPGTDAVNCRLCVPGSRTKAAREMARDRLRTFSRCAPNSQPPSLGLAPAPGFEIDLGLLS